MSASFGLQFMLLAGQLKRTLRKGWLESGVPGRVESVADHSFRMALSVSQLLPQDIKVDRFKCVEMALVHDLAESLVGDITPRDKVASEVKHAKEMEAVMELGDLLREFSNERKSKFVSLFMRHGDQGSGGSLKLIKS
ncbi:hypothetical protein ACOME3_000143 [Neoechinorhynchus agilis]